MSDNRTNDPALSPNPEPTSPNPDSPADPSLLGVQPEPEVLVEPEESPPFDLEKITLPENFEKTEAFTKFGELAAEHKLSLPAAQALFDLYHNEISERVKSDMSFWSTQQSKWLEEVQKDSELGGDKLPNVKQTVARVLDNTELSDPGFRAALDFSGMGSNPAVVRTLYRWAARLTEGGAVSGGDPPARNRDGSLASQRPAPAQSLYGPDGPYTGGPKIGS